MEVSLQELGSVVTVFCFCKMRCFLIFCFLLASAHDIASTARPKRDLWPVKNFLLSKLFGSETVILQLPKIPKNETYQLFRINGYDNIFLKVTRKAVKETERPVKIKYEEPVMVSPEMAIIGNYLGTPTQKETLLALDIAKNLLQSGVLQNEEKKLAIPIVSQYSEGYVVREPVKAITEERIPIYVDQPVAIDVENHRPVALYPAEPMAITSEVKYRPLQTKYVYKQETENADMTFESYNNQGVIVTRTNKVPVKPYYIAMRLVDVVSMAVNPYLIRTQPSLVGKHQQLNVVPIHSYVTEKSLHPSPSPEAAGEADQAEYVELSNSDFHSSTSERDPLSSPKFESAQVPMFIQQSKLPFDIRDHLTDGEVDKLNKFINAKLDIGRNNAKVFTPPSHNDENDSDADMNNDKKAAANDNQTSPGKIVARYSYKQLGDESHGNFTHVKIEDPKLNQSEINIKSGDSIPPNYVYVPPDVYIPPMQELYSTVFKNVNALPPQQNTNSLNDQNGHNRYDDYENFSNDAENDPKTSVPITLRGDQGQLEAPTGVPGKLKTNDQHSITNNPIVVPDFSNKPNNVRTLPGSMKTSSGRPHTGGQEPNSTRKTSSPKLYTGGSGVRNG